MKLFGPYIRELRQQDNLPLRRVAAYLDIDTSILSKIERSERVASREQVVRAAEFFEIPEKEMLERYYGDQIARMIYHEENCNEILSVAEEQLKYYRNNATTQGNLNF